MMDSIVDIYNRVLRDDPSLTMPCAAIESLIQVLVHSKETTIQGTLTELKAQSEALKARVPNSISLTAGTDLFIQTILQHLRHEGNDSFEQIRDHLIANGKVFSERAKKARARIAEVARPCILQPVNNVILTHGGSRVVAEILLNAAKPGPQGQLPRFKVIYVMTPDSRTHYTQSVISQLRAKGVAVATIPCEAISWGVEMATKVIVGAEGVGQMGGIVSRMGTTPIAIMAKTLGRPFYVAVETHKFVQIITVRQRELEVKQNIIEFSKDEVSVEEEKPAEIPEGDQPTGYFDESAKPDVVDESAAPAKPEIIDDSAGPVDWVVSTLASTPSKHLLIMSIACDVYHQFLHRGWYLELRQSHRGASQDLHVANDGYNVARNHWKHSDCISLLVCHDGFILIS